MAPLTQSPRIWQILPFLLPFSISTTGCYSPDATSLTADHEASLVDTLLAITHAYNAAWGEWRAEPILEFHGEDFQYYFFDERIGEEFESVLREIWLPASQGYSIEMIDPQVEILGRDGAIVSFQYRDREVTNSGSIQENRGALGYIFERRAGKWKIVRIHHSGTVPEMYQRE